jgi:hypothetical protein
LRYLYIKNNGKRHKIGDTGNDQHATEAVFLVKCDPSVNEV